MRGARTGKSRTWRAAPPLKVIDALFPLHDQRELESLVAQTVAESYGSLHHLTGGDLVGDDFWKETDGTHAVPPLYGQHFAAPSVFEARLTKLVSAWLGGTIFRPGRDIAARSHAGAWPGPT